MTPEQIARTFNPASQKHYDEGCRDTIDNVLEIIEKERDSVTRTANIDEEYVSAFTVLIEIRKAVLALKEGTYDEG